MNIRRISAAVAGAAVLFSAGLVGAPAVQAATTVTVDCATSISEAFTVAPGEQIIFSLNNACQTGMASYGVTNTATLQVIVNKMAILTGTGGTAVANVAGASWTVTYTAGPNSGTDYLDVSAVGATRARHLRALTTSNDYSMTIPGSDPVPWLQAYARKSTDTCDAGWSPSWAEWPNGHTGGFVCVRMYVYNTSSGAWDIRKGSRY